MARADLALATGLTSVFPVLSAFLTPIVCEIALKAVPDAGAIRFNLPGVLLTLVTGLAILARYGLVAELSLGLGYWLCGGSAGSRQVVELGTSNRNIALALLMAVQSFAGTPVMSAVVANGLLLILLGLLHVAWWRAAADARRLWLLTAQPDSQPDLNLCQK